MKKLAYIVLGLSLAYVCAGCASEDGGQIVGGILTGIGAGLSGL